MIFKKIEAVANLHDFKKSMILKAPCPNLLTGSNIRDENILEKVGESLLGQGATKKRFCIRKSFATGLIFFLLIFSLQSVYTIPLEERFKQSGYVEIYNENHNSETFDALYAYFDEFVEFVQKNPDWERKLYVLKERFIRSKDQSIYSTDFFGLYDESKRTGRGQISFYYSIHFHEFILSRCPECSQIPEIVRFLEACLEIQKPYGYLFEQAAFELGLQTIFSSDYGQPPILFKVVKYLPSYLVTRPHYDGTALTLFLDSTDNQSLLLSPYKSRFTIDDFFVPSREFSRSILLIPGALLTEFSIPPTPHIVLQKGKTRYATIAFAMRPNYTQKKHAHPVLPNFRD